MATKAGVIWFVDEDEVVKRILEVVCRDEIAMAITYQEAKEHDTFKEGRATKRRRKDGPFSKTQSSSTWGDESIHLRVLRNYLPEEKYWEPGPLTESLFHCFTFWGTTSVLLGCFCLFLGGAVVVLFCWLTGHPPFCM